MKLKYQLFCVLLLVSATLIATLYAFNSWNFDRSFVSYINKSQNRTLQVLAETVAEAYSENQNWDWIADKERQWNRMTGQILRRYDNQQQPLAVRRVGQTNVNSDPIGNNRRRLQRLRLILTDENKNPIVGSKRAAGNGTDWEQADWLPIKVDDTIVGHLGYTRIKGMPSRLEQIFAATQKKNLALSSLLMVALSGILAALLAPRIVKPVLTVSQAVDEINRGQYNQRVESNRRDELGDLSRDVNQLAHTLEQSRTARRNWIAEISHELRTPVAILQGEIESINDGIRPFDKNSLGSLQTETFRLGRLINDLHDLSLSDIGALNYRMEVLDIVGLIQQRLDSVESQCREARIAVDLITGSTTVLIMGDSQRLTQLIDNLLQNSLRYTNANGTIKIDLTILDEQNSLNIDWNDSSPGIDDDNLPRLFDPLFRAEPSRNRTLGGAGLGLAIVKKIVDAHQGSISANHSDLGGVAISIQLPLFDQASI